MKTFLVIGTILIGIGALMIFVFGPNIMAMFGYNNEYYTYVDNTFLSNNFEKSNDKIQIDEKNNTIKFLGSEVTLPVVASPEYGSMYSFGIYGLVNPTIIVEKNAQITIQFVNLDDDMYHGIMITSNSPPYTFMQNMMFETTPFNNSIIRPIPSAKENKYPSSSTTFITDNAGIFYYICQVPGHASKGMYGKFIVYR
jgi:rusticyanin